MVESKVHPFFSENVEELKTSFKKYYDDEKFQGRNVGRRLIERSEYKELVLNYVTLVKIREDYVKILTLDNENLEPILKFGKYEDEDNNYYIKFTDYYFITHLFVDKLENVLEKKLQFTIYNVSKMFCDFWNALNFLKSQNICHGSICPNNLAFNGKNWYVSGLLSTQKNGECMIGCYTMIENLPFISYKSRRSNISNCNSSKSRDCELDIVPSDDMWQLVLMYVITYYGFNPFGNNIFKIFTNIYEGECQEISKSVYGKYLKEILTNENEMKNDDYDKILNIFENNTDDHF
jgi:hypothetical protein